MSDSNPLASRRASRPAPEHPMMMHAKAWKHVSGLPPEQLPTKSSQLDYALPIIGALAGNPNVKPKDVIKAAASAAADGKIEPSEAVALISAMPQDPDKLQPWLRNMYAANMSAQVHMKAALMASAQPASGAPQSGGPVASPAAPSQAPEAPL